MESKEEILTEGKNIILKVPILFEGIPQETEKQLSNVFTIDEISYNCKGHIEHRLIHTGETQIYVPQKKGRAIFLKMKQINKKINEVNNT